MSSPASAENRNSFLEHAEAYLLILFLSVFGILCYTSPSFTLRTVLSAGSVALYFYAAYHFIRYFTSGKTRPMDLYSSLIVVGFAWVLSWNMYLPEWLLRVSFGLYCLGIFFVLFIQLAVRFSENSSLSLSTLLFVIIYGLMGYVLLFTHLVDANLLIRLFGVYFTILAGRMLIDQFNLHSAKYKWKRGLHVSLPLALATLMPDWAQKSINAKIHEGEAVPLDSVKKEEKTRLKVMVHIGPEGFQKVGHFTFSWDGIVYSYGNYDLESGRLFGLLGDGVFFTVPKEIYIPNVVKYEKNTIFEYAISTTPYQDHQIEDQLKALKERSYRWYAPIEREGDYRHPKGIDEAYVNRLHWRTGAKFYKLRGGTFSTYWVAGDNCVLFADEILGSIGADVLSLRGIITPGAYYDYLENEYQKSNSPVIEKHVYSFTQTHGGI